MPAARRLHRLDGRDARRDTSTEVPRLGRGRVGGTVAWRREDNREVLIGVAREGGAAEVPHQPLPAKTNGSQCERTNRMNACMHRRHGGGLCVRARSLPACTPCRANGSSRGRVERSAARAPRRPRTPCCCNAACFNLPVAKQKKIVTVLTLIHSG